MQYDYRDKKIAILLDGKLKAAVALTVAASLGASMGAFGDGPMGQDQVSDKTGAKHRGLPKYPVGVFKVKVAQLREALNRARGMSELFVAECPTIFLDAAGDGELVRTFENTDEQNLDYMGILIYGPRDTVDSFTIRLRPWW